MSTFNWACPYCNRDQTIDTKDRGEYREHTMTLWNEGRKHYDITFYAIRCRNSACERFTVDANLDVADGRIIYGPMANSLDNPAVEQVFPMKPDSNAKPQPDYIPTFLIEDYQEACRIKNLSPKASAALCRRCLQGMIRDFFGVCKETLFQEISAIKDRCDPDVWQSMDAIREVGNIGAHMQKDVNLIIDVDEEEAQILIDLIEQLFEDWYVTKHKRQAKLDAANKLKDAKSFQKNKASTVVKDKVSEQNNVAS